MQLASECLRLEKSLCCAHASYSCQLVLSGLVEGLVLSRVLVHALQFWHTRFCLRQRTPGHTHALTAFTTKYVSVYSEVAAAWSEVVAPLGWINLVGCHLLCRAVSVA